MPRQLLEIAKRKRAGELGRAARAFGKDEEQPLVKLCPACRVELVGLMEALLREIAATLANVRSGESVDEQDHR